MAGFEGTDDPGGRSPKLPSWAVTNRQPEDDPGAAPPAPADGSFADLGVRPDVTRPPRAEAPVSRVPEHPFDVDDPFGDKHPGGGASPWVRGPADDTEVRLVDLADEFHLTTVQALEVCEASGTPATSGAVWLTVAQADAFRVAVAALDRTPGADDAFPSWAVPPGGRPGAPTFAPPAARTSRATGAGSPPARPVRNDATTPAPEVGSATAAEPAGGRSVLRIVLVALAVLALVACVAALLAVLAS